MRIMADSPEWIILAAYENVAGCPAPSAWVRAWLRERGIDWIPFQEDRERGIDWMPSQEDAVRIDLAW